MPRQKKKPRVVPSRTWAQTWYSKRSQRIDDIILISSELPAILSLSQSLLCVSLGQNFIGDDGAVALSDVLASCLLLKRIDVSDNRIGSRGAIALSKICTPCVSISEVVLSRNPLGDEGGYAFATAFQECSEPTIELLQMSGCQLSSSCMPKFADAICVQSNLISLDLSRNNIDSPGAVCISDSLSAHDHIENLDFSHNHIGDAGIIAISRCMSLSNFSIKRIGLENNDVTYYGAVVMLSTLHSRNGLDYISLGQLDPCGPLQSVVRSAAWQHTGLPTPPDEVREWIPGLAFIREALVSGSETVRRMRFMLIGNGMAGKTRLAGALLNIQGNSYPVDSHPDVDVENRTVGIDRSYLPLDSSQGCIDVELWDFAGQEVSYLSHTQYFSARRCIYILVWSPFQPPPLNDPAAALAAVHVPSFASADDVTKPLILWMEMLFLQVPGAQFMLCGTHATLAKQHNEINYAALFTAVEATVQQKLADLAALGRAELRDLKKRQQELEKKLQDASSGMSSSAAVANEEDVVLWNRLSQDMRKSGRIRQTAVAAAKDAILLRSVRARIAAIQDDSTDPPSCRHLQLLDCVRVDSSDGSGISDMRDVLSWHCESMPVLSEDIPKAWVVVESLFTSMLTKFGNVVSRDDAVSFLSKAMSDLRQPWEAIEFWGYLGRIFVYESSPGSAKQWWIVPNMMFLLDIIRPLIHWDPHRMLTTNPDFFVASALELHCDDRNECIELLRELKRDCVLRRRLLKYLAKWSCLQSEQQDAMLDFFHKCHLICALDDSAMPFCVPFRSQCDRYLVTARVRNMAARLMVPAPAASDMSTYHALFCLPLLHVSFLIRLQSRVLSRKTSIKLCVQLQQECLLVRRRSVHQDKFYFCTQCMSSVQFDNIQRSLSDESVSQDEYQNVIHVHSDDLGLFQFAMQTIEETLSTLFSGLRHKCYILTDRDNFSGRGVWFQVGYQSVPAFSELLKKNWFEPICHDNSLTLQSLFPIKRCPIFISHSWSDGTEEFVRLLRLHLQDESLSAVCLDSAFFPQSSACAVQNAFQSGLCEAGVVIVCLTPRYLTRPNCLKEFQWALDLSAKKKLSVFFLPLHPALTFDGIKSMLKSKVVFVSAKDDAACCLMPLSDLSIELLNRYLLEHIGDQKLFKHRWPVLKAWLSDGPDDEWDNTAFVPAVRHLVSQPAFSDSLVFECRTDENVALCENVTHKLVSVDAIFKKNLSYDHMQSFSSEFYPEESAARFFWAFSEVLEVHLLTGWKDMPFKVVPLVKANGEAADGMSFQVFSEFDELKLLSSDVPPFKNVKLAKMIQISAILVPSGTSIDKIRVSDASKRELWIHVLKKLPVVHEPRSSVVQPAVQAQPGQLASKCDFYISTCRHASVSGGRNLRLYLSAMMDALWRVTDLLATTITFEIGNLMTESSSDTAARAENRIYFLTDSIASDLQDGYDVSKRCQCVGCHEMSHHAVHSRFVAMHRINNALLRSLRNDVMTIPDVSFEGDLISECIPTEAYLEGAALDLLFMRLLDLRATHTKVGMQILGRNFIGTSEPVLMAGKYYGDADDQVWSLHIFESFTAT
jgi:GTPase SAR1 family protein